MNKKTSILNVAGLAMFASGAAMAQYTGTSHPDDLSITTNAPAAAPATMPVDRYAAAQPVQPVPVPQPAPAAAFTPTVAPIDPYASVAPAPVSAPAPVVAADSPAPPLSARSAPSARPADEDGVVVRVAGPSDRMPEGTLLTLRLTQALSTKITAEGSEWTGELITPLERDGQILVPTGSLVRGKVTQVHGGKRIHGRAEIHLTALSVTLPDGSRRGMHAQVIDTDQNQTLRVDREGTIVHRDHRKEEAGVLALTVGSGAAVGALVAGVPGALVGAGVGAGVSGVIYLKQDKQAELPQGAVVTFELTRSVGLGQE